MATMGDPLQIRAWQIDGLPTDSVSSDNAVVTARTMRWPLMIDPQGQANRWIKNLQKENRLRVTKMTQSDFLRVLEHIAQSLPPLGSFEQRTVPPMSTLWAAGCIRHPSARRAP